MNQTTDQPDALCTYRDAETREILGDVLPTAARNWEGRAKEDGDFTVRFFPTYTEADNWVRGVLGLDD